MKKIILLILMTVSLQSYAAKFYFKDNFLTYYSSHEFSVEDTDIERLVIVIHGALRNGDEYFVDTLRSAKKHGVEKSTMIVAPHFRRDTDKREPNEIYYGSRWYQKWKYGYVSQDSDKVSSFTLIDKLIHQVSDSGKFPNLKNIVITGHSAGGQFTQRYAIGSKVSELVSSSVEFVPSNPSSYMYLDSERFTFREGNFEILDIPQNCPEFNHYIYGPTDRAEYLARYSIKELKANFQKNKVTYLMSEEDKGTDSLDRSCEAMVQGKNRIERAINYYYYDKKYLSGHKFVSIPNIAHEHADVYNSEEAGKVVFGLEKNIPQDYLYKKIGNIVDKTSQPQRLFVLLGGGKNEINGFQEFLSAANGGDVLVISAKDELNHRYTHDLWNMASESNIKIDSVETISLLNKNASFNSFVIEKVQKAEAIFFTGGDQSKYISRIKGTPLHQVILDKVKSGVPIAGTSAGLAIMGEYIFSANFGGLSARYVLKNPHAKEITIEKGFFNSPILNGLITDTHFMNRNREGRLLGFMFRTQFDYQLKTLYGVGVDEQTSVLITDNSMTSYGVGGAYFFKQESPHIPQRQVGELVLSPIRKITLEHSKRLPHFHELDFSLGDLIVGSEDN